MLGYHKLAVYNVNIWDLQEDMKDQSYRDIGMVVAKEHRKKGIGTFILIKLK